MPELLAPAPSPEAVIAAVQNGADAVYLRYGGLVPKSRSSQFSKEEFRCAAEYCRVRGVKLYADLSGLVRDDVFSRFAAVLKSAAALGADGVILDDLGAIRVARAVVPDMPIHAGRRLAVHSLDGAKALGDLGLRRVTISPELSRQEVAHVARRCGLESEIMVHGPLCAAHPGSCLMSAYLSGEGDSRGLCTAPCLQNFVLNKNSAPYLSAKDLCLAGRVEDFAKCGITALRIDGATRRPEYTALLTKLYAKVLKDRWPPEAAELARVSQALGLKESTDAPFMNRREEPVLGAAPGAVPDDNTVLAEARRGYLSGEYQRVPLNYAVVVRAGAPIKLAAEDDRGIIVTVEGPVPGAALNAPITYSRLKTLFYRTEGTPFLFGSMRISIDEGLELPGPVLTDLLHSLLKKMQEARRAYTPFKAEDYHAGLKYMNPKAAPLLNISVSRPEQLTAELAGMRPARLYVPLRLLAESPKLLLPFWDNEYTDVAAVLPPIIHEADRPQIEKRLEVARRLNVQDLAIHDPGQIALAAPFGFRLHGDTGFNAYNSHCMRALKDLGLLSATVSYEASFKQIRELSKAVDTELVVYGRIPLMVTDRCISKEALGRCSCENSTELYDARGAAYPILPTEGCGSTLYSPGKLFFGGSRRVYQALGLWGVRLQFTTENPAECVQIMERYIGRGRYEPTGKTRGLYPRGVE